MDLGGGLKPLFPLPQTRLPGTPLRRPPSPGHPSLGHTLPDPPSPGPPSQGPPKISFFSVHNRDPRPQFQEKTPRERKKDTRRPPERKQKAKMEAGEGKKREILGPPPLWAPTPKKENWPNQHCHLCVCSPNDHTSTKHKGSSQGTVAHCK